MCSAFDHISMTTYRIETLEKEAQVLGSSFTIVGYRIGTLISGAGALVLADYFSWEVAYCLISLGGLIGIATILLSPEPDHTQEPSQSFTSTVDSFLELIKMDKISLIIIFVIAFRLGDHLISGFSNNFYVSIGFSKIEIANIIKIYGIIPTILGGVIGGWITMKIGIRKALLFFGGLEALSPFFYLIQNYAGKNFSILYFTITIGQFITGMAASVFMAYIGYISSHPTMTATRYSQLSSIKSLGGVFMGALTGVIIDLCGWSVFFILCTLVSLPCLWILIKMDNNFPLSLDEKHETIS
jgi:PAT family beta-lactamase induction signal transducer AmpG